MDQQALTVGSDLQMMEPIAKTVVKTHSNGRPKVNRDLALRLMKARTNGLNTYNTAQICRALGCSKDTFFVIRKELREAGLLDSSIVNREAGLVEGEFDEECKRAMGTSFYEWLKIQTPVGANPTFNFCNMVWINVWDRPSLVTVKDINENLGNQLCQNFNTYFNNDVMRMRRRLKFIRYIFRFLGRMDLCDRNLKMTDAKQPRNVRRIDQIELANFPTLFNTAINNMNEYDRLILKTKCVFQGRTGNRIKEKGMEGLKKDTGKSHLIMNSEDDFRCHILDKSNEEWDITYIPKEIRAGLYEIYKSINSGDYMFDLKGLSIRWGIETQKTLGINLTLHDLRKISITFYYALGIPLEIAIDLNIGWKDLNTPKLHYLHLRKLLKKSDKKAYSDQIPTWFKDGIEEYVDA
jgi:hypothetical protein